MKSTYKKLEKAMEKLSKETSIIFLPSFQCCGTCAGAELYGFMDTPPNPEYAQYDYAIHFNEQTAERAVDNFALDLTIAPLKKQAKEEVAEFLEIFKKHLLDAKLKEVFTYPESRMEMTDDMWNGFFMTEWQDVAVFGYFDGLEPEDEDEDDYEDDWAHEQEDDEED